MKVRGFDGRFYKWNLSKYRRKKKKASEPHKRARKLLNKRFKLFSILEEATIPGSKTKRRKSSLYCDFFIPELRVMIEVHGRQHYEFIPHFHANKKSFAKAKMRDREKKEWCELNDIEYIELPAHETEEQWVERLKHV